MSEAGEFPSGPYLIRSRIGRLYVHGLDVFLSLAPRGRPAPQRPVRRLLIGVGGHIGDAIIASSALRWIRQALPSVRIGVASSSVARPVLAGHAMVEWTHVVDHWKLNRGGSTWLQKRAASRASFVMARQEIRDVGYDAAVDLYPFYPTMAVLFWRAGVPRRVGFASGGGGPVLTDSLTWVESDRHIAWYHREPLRVLAPDNDSPLAYDLPPLSSGVEGETRRLLLESNVEPDTYVVLHPGSGDRRKKWPLDRWIDLAGLLIQAGRSVVVTGAGREDREAVTAMRLRHPSIVSLCDATDLATLRCVLSHAAAVVATDSAAAHLAAAEGAQGVVIMSRITNVSRWRPLSDRLEVQMETVAPSAVHGVLQRMSTDRAPASAGRR